MFEFGLVQPQRTVFLAESRPQGMEILRLASLTYLQPLSMGELAAIAPLAAEISMPAGRRVLLNGPFAQELVLVASGRARMRWAGEPAGDLGPGDAFGPLAPRRTTYATATVTALTDLRLVTFSTRDVDHLRRTAPDTLAALLAACAQGPRQHAAANRGPVPAHAAAA